MKKQRGIILLLTSIITGIITISISQNIQNIADLNDIIKNLHNA